MIEPNRTDIEVELCPPPTLPKRRGSELIAGIQLLPEERLRAFAPDQLELVIAHWLHEAVRHRYSRAVRIGGSGDRGRDVVAYRRDGSGWDNYQSKRYAEKLTPSNIWQEVGKLV